MAEDNRTKSIIWVLINNYITLPLGLGYNLISKRILGEIAPKLTSDAVFAGSFFKYFDMAFFPFVSSLSREIPLSKSSDPAYAKRVADVVFTISFTFSILALIVFSILGYLTSDLILKLIFYAVGAAAIFKFLHRTINVYLSSHGQFIKKSKVSLRVVFIKIPVCLILIYFFREYGYVIAIFITSALLGFFYIFLIDWQKVSLQFDFPLIKLLFMRAIPFTLYMGIETILFTFDKFLIRNISPIELGIYGFAFNMAFMVYETPKMIYSTLFPFFIKELKESYLTDVFKRITNTQSRILVFTTFMIATAFSGFILILHYFLPYFKGAEIYALILFLIPYVYSFNYVFYVYCISKRYDKEISILAIMAILIALFLFGAAYIFDLNSRYISLIVVFVLFLNSCFIIFFLVRKYKIEPLKVIKLYGIFILLLIPYLIVCIPVLYESVMESWQFSLLIKQLVFWLLSVLVLYIIVKFAMPDLLITLVRKIKEASFNRK